MTRTAYHKLTHACNLKTKLKKKTKKIVFRKWLHFQKMVAFENETKNKKEIENTFQKIPYQFWDFQNLLEDI